MSGSFAAVNPANMELSPMRIKFDGTDVGGTLGTVKLNIDYKKTPLKADQMGDTDLDYAVSGMALTLETMFAETIAKRLWKIAFPNADLLTGNVGVNFVSSIGQRDLALAKALIGHPLSLADGDLSRDINIYKAIAAGKSDVVYGPSGQQAIKVLWRLLPDTGVVPARFLFHGDPANGIVAASAGSPSFSGTGNGTVTLVSAMNGFGGTLTENIVITCVGSSSGNNFYVAGSLSGPLGEFHIAAAAASTYAFSCARIAFTLTQGSTQFVTNDAFTIATVASNYA